MGFLGPNALQRIARDTVGNQDVYRYVQGNGGTTYEIPDAAGTLNIQLTTQQDNVLVDEPATSGTVNLLLPPVTECKYRTFSVKVVTNGSGAVHVKDKGDAYAALDATVASPAVALFYSTGLEWAQIA